MAENVFLLQSDPERRLAFREDLKRRLAAIQAGQELVDEHNRAIAALDADCDVAAEEHRKGAEKLQSELNQLDETRTKAIMGGKSAPAGALARRDEVLAELSRLNFSLEHRCGVNRHAKQLREKQLAQAQSGLVDRQTVENRLEALCDPSTRQKLMAASYAVDALRAAVVAVQRAVKPLRETLREYRLREDATNSAITAARLADAEATAVLVQAAFRKAEEELTSVRLQARTE